MYARYVPPAKESRASAAGHVTVDAMKPKLVEEFSYTRYVPASKANQVAETLPGPKSIQFFDEPTPVSSKRKRDSAIEPRSDTKKSRKVESESSGTNRITEGSGSAAHEKPGERKKKNRRKRKQRTQAADDDSDNSEDSEAHKRSPPKLTRRNQARNDEASEVEERVVVIDPSEPFKNDESPRSDEEIDDAPTSSHAKSDAGLKEKKHRGEKKKKAGNDGPMEEEADPDEKALARHKAVLERKSKSIKLAAEAAQEQGKDSDEEPAESHALEPLPQPAILPEDDSKPTYETLPTWLSAPIRVPQDTRKAFTELGITQRSSRLLAEKGYSEAFAVQTAAIPLLLPTSKQLPGDVLISAATGSGKTLAYAIPISRDISQGVVTRLRALVVLPTRELVRQAQDVFEMCARVYEGEDHKRVRVGVAVGSQSLKLEQDTLVERDSRYDPDTYRRIHDEAQKQQSSELTLADATDFNSISDPQLGAWEGEVIEFTSKVDVLICTPGRLVEHIEQTPGFSLDYVRWLVVDEADKLLAQSFQGWLELVLEKFQVEKFSARDFPDMAYTGVRKVILSATLTRDLSLLNQLSLRRPRLIVLENGGAVQVAEHTLPMTLREHAVRVHDANLKPLYLLQLLQSSHMKAMLTVKDRDSSWVLHGNDDRQSSSSSETSSEESDSTSNVDTSSDSTDTSDGDDDGDGDGDEARTAAFTKSNLPISLIFTKSNEAALRLSRLLILLDPSIKAQISTITSATPTHIRRKMLRAFSTSSTPVRVIIASDLVARGIDIPHLSHVVNYDIPASVAGYVHRVGRTARAGRPGCAWTLISDDESGWFWGKIAKNQGIKRAQTVDRTRLDEMSEEDIDRYGNALARLGKEALDLGRKK